MNSINPWRLSRRSEQGPSHIFLLRYNFQVRVRFFRTPVFNKHGGIKALKPKNIFLLSFAAALVLFSAVPSSAEVSIGYAQDILHASGTSAGIVRYDHLPTRLGAQAMYWDGPDDSNMSFGVDFDLLPSKILDLNLGGVYIARTRSINGTNLNFSIGLGVNLGERVRFQFSHFSNAHAKNNEGWNFVGIMLRL